VVHESVNGPGVGNIAVREYRINSKFDPEATLGGHQPAGFDELMEKYEKFTVLKCHVEIENMSNIGVRALFLCIIREQQPGDVAGQYASGDGLNGIMERDGVSETLSLCLSDMQAGKRKAHMWFDMSKFTGKTYRGL